MCKMLHSNDIQTVVTIEKNCLVRNKHAEKFVPRFLLNLFDGKTIKQAFIDAQISSNHDARGY